MIRYFSLVGIFMLILGNLAQAQTPNNATVNCRFADKNLRCHAVANIHNQGEAADHLLVNCPGLGNDTIVFNGHAEVAANSEVVINPEGSDSVPAIVLPSNALACHRTPTVVDAMLVLPERAPYDGAELEGRCRIVTAGCEENF